jgi:dipeptidyl-peptidase-4
MADQGFIVVSMTSRGTPERGRTWERVTKHDVISIPLKEQTEGTLALCGRFGEMDRSRIGIYGWSFGGYFSVLAAELRPDVYRAAMAGAPVTDWREYDTHYTERYMGLPTDNPEGYRDTSALTHAGKLSIPLMIVHGTVDDNVFPVNTARLVDVKFHAVQSDFFGAASEKAPCRATNGQRPPS